MGKYQSGQMGQTVNLLAYAFGGSNPSLPTKQIEDVNFNSHPLFFFINSYGEVRICLLTLIQRGCAKI